MDGDTMGAAISSMAFIIEGNQCDDGQKQKILHPKGNTLLTTVINESQKATSFIIDILLRHFQVQYSSSTPRD